MENSPIYVEVTRRQTMIIREIRDHAARYAYPHSGAGLNDPVRYLADGHIPHCTHEEREFIKTYIRLHPEVIDRHPLTIAELEQRDARDRERAGQVAEHARELFNVGEFTAALYLIDRAEHLDPGSFARWDRLRTLICTARELDKNCSDSLIFASK
ncbi:hypothetical protein Lfu02_15120 [Longispora fulva]|uniref:Uncharacterized protein n=1 Tax=Longispora fulva TaxID=619741 RepID=A0A8J7GGW7_9ACTN|nr:hypothetical protein [Longispora fulva]MBG6140478.1 hypothetical protein [Longispora fulva]GIG57140.1 hypothetical protein Lfu02_15120 [Longispora fulva]